jgi:hypothetical protein
MSADGVENDSADRPLERLNACTNATNDYGSAGAAALPLSTAFAAAQRNRRPEQSAPSRFFRKEHPLLRPYVAAELCAANEMQLGALIVAGQHSDGATSRCAVLPVPVLLDALPQHTRRVRFQVISGFRPCILHIFSLGVPLQRSAVPVVPVQQRSNGPPRMGQRSGWQPIARSGLLQYFTHASPHLGCCDWCFWIA